MANFPFTIHHICVRPLMSNLRHRFHNAIITAPLIINDTPKIFLAPIFSLNTRYDSTIVHTYVMEVKGKTLLYSIWCSTYILNKAAMRYIKQPRYKYRDDSICKIDPHPAIFLKNTDA